MHIAVIAPLIWAGGGSQERQERRYRGETALQWVILDDSPRTAPVTVASLSLPRLVSIGVSEDLAAPSVTPPAPASKEKNAESEERSSLGALYGRYVGQIHARIDRAWIRPRTAIGAPIFQCQVQIDQDRLGQVGEVTLVQCNGDARWQLSVVRAIEGASPLPAPPNPAVFARHIVLEFRAMAYAPGMPGGLYEPPTAAGEHAGVLGAAQSQNAFQTLRQATTASHSHRALALRIEGSQVEVEPNR
ncbi:MAG: energy transducer TonB [Steroidobacteraceae bacterium]